MLVNSQRMFLARGIVESAYQQHRRLGHFHAYRRAIYGCGDSGASRTLPSAYSIFRAGFFGQSGATKSSGAPSVQAAAFTTGGGRSGNSAAGGAPEDAQSHFREFDLDCGSAISAKAETEAGVCE